MNKLIILFSVLSSVAAIAAEYDIKDFKISTADFVDNHKVSKDGRCSVKVEKWIGSPFSSLYVYDRDDNMYQNSIAFAETEDGTTLIAADAVNDSCSLDADKKSTSITCRGFGFHETVSIKVDKAGLIKEINHLERGAGIGGHSLPLPYVRNKKLNCVF